MTDLVSLEELDITNTVTVNPNSLDYSNLIEELSEKSWCYFPNQISPTLCQELYQKYSDQRENFHEAKIGNFTLKQKDKSIRKSLIMWLEDWRESSATLFLNDFYKKLTKKIRNSFYIPLEWHETQIALYSEGDYYKKHLDQLKLTKHRQVTTVLFLNDCAEGGELVIYNKDDKTKIDKIIKPERGGLVIFFSAHIFHEVRPTKDKRMTLTTWLRDDAVPFLDHF